MPQRPKALFKVDAQCPDRDVVVGHRESDVPDAGNVDYFFARLGPHWSSFLSALFDVYFCIIH